MKQLLAALCTLTLVACSDPAVGPSPVESVEIRAGNDQVGVAGFRLADSLEVRVVDADGEPVANALVRWGTEDRDARLDPTASTTNADGIARTAWRLGRDDGTQAVTATYSNLPASNRTAGRLL